MIRKSSLLLLIVLSASIASAADRLPSPDKTLTAVIEPFIKTKNKVAENVINISKADGVSLVQKDFRSPDREHGWIIDKIQWTSDSNFLVFSTYSSGGHQPWNSPTFFFSRRDNKIRQIDDIVGPILDSNFEIATSDIVKIYVCDKISGVDKELAVHLSDLIK